VASIVLVMVPDVWAASRRPASISFAAAWIIAARTAISQSADTSTEKAPLADAAAASQAIHDVVVAVRTSQPLASR
jgi:hypothetical protein